MGWTYFDKPAGEKTADYIKRTLTWEHGGVKNTCLDVAIVKLRTAYAAVETVRPDGTREVWASVWLLDYPRNYRFNFGYKDMDESMGPCEDECPERILKLLTPTDHEYAQKWRARCWENIKRRTAKPKVTDGCTLRFAAPFTFTDGHKADTFTYYRKRGYHNNVFQSHQNGRIYRITGWRSYDYSVVAG